MILPLAVLRRFDSLLAPTKAQVLAEHPKIKRLDLPKLLDDPNQLAPNLNAYINGFSKNVREIMERFAFDQQIARMAEKNLLYEVIKAFCDPKIDLTFPGLTPAQANVQMGYVFEELIRIGAEQSNEEAGEHFTPREVIKLMVNLLLSPEQDLRKSHVVKTIYDPACGTGGMLSVPACHQRSHAFRHRHCGGLRRVVNDDRQLAANRRSSHHQPHRNARRNSERLTLPEHGAVCRRLEALLSVKHVKCFDTGMMMSRRVHSRRERASKSPCFGTLIALSRRSVRAPGHVIARGEWVKNP